METWVILVFGAMGFLVSRSLTPAVLKWAARRSDGAQGRSFHHTHGAPIPRFGGIAIV